MKSLKGSASIALDTLRTLLAKDAGRKARLEAMADNIRRKALVDPRRIGCGESFDGLFALGKEAQL